MKCVSLLSGLYQLSINLYNVTVTFNLTDLGLSFESYNEMWLWFLGTKLMTPACNSKLNFIIRVPFRKFKLSNI